MGTHLVKDHDVKGLLFDCDGTLLDSMPLFYKSWVATSGKFGLSLSEEEFYGYAGMPLPDIVRSMHRTQKGSECTEAFIADFLKEKKKAHHGIEAKVGSPRPIECVVRIARDAEARGIPIAVATSGLRDHVEAHLSSAGLSDLFNSKRANVVCAVDVPQGKPAPDIFVEAAKRIGVDPRACRAYEDGESGLQSAFAAGCQVIDCTKMPSYPTCSGLQKSKEVSAKQRTWHLATDKKPAAAESWWAFLECSCAANRK